MGATARTSAAIWACASEAFDPRGGRRSHVDSKAEASRYAPIQHPLKWRHQLHEPKIVTELSLESLQAGVLDGISETVRAHPDFLNRLRPSLIGVWTRDKVDQLASRLAQEPPNDLTDAILIVRRNPFSEATVTSLNGYG